MTPLGFSHAVVSAPGRLVFVGGQTAHDGNGSIRSDDLVEQFEVAASNVVKALDAAGARPQDLVSMQIFVTDAAAYRSKLRPIGEAYRRHFGRHYPALSLFEVRALFDPRAKVELVCTAVVPES